MRIINQYSIYVTNSRFLCSINLFFVVIVNLYSPFEFTIFPLTFLDLSCFDVDFFALTIFLVIFPVSDIVVSIAINLASITISLAIVFTLSLINMTIRFSKDLSANTFNFISVATHLAIAVSLLTIHSLSELSFKINFLF